MRRVVRCVCGQEMRVPAEALYRYGACVACGTRIKITEDNSHLETDEMALPGNHSHSAGPPGPFGAESTDFALPHDNCSRCGRAFRGDWDRHNSAAGALCDLCARQAPAPQTPDLITGGIERVSEVVPVPTASFSV
ncbi:MAG: hypothetical protein HYZ00_11000, partial [Candidatus Hydrogenedentes bacterium]|nr:hypothetical protein [Candidatus Hydrogenedentota bacterium]